MKKSRALLVLLIFLVAAYLFLEKKGLTVKDDPQNAVQRLFSAEEASVSELPINDSIARTSPQTFLFVYSRPKSVLAMMIMNSLPKTLREFDPLLTHLPHGNVTAVEVDGQRYGLVPKYMFSGVDLTQLFEESGFQPKELGTKDFLTISLKNEEQAFITAQLFERLDPDKLNGVSCTIRTLNCYEGKPVPYEYVMQGKLHYLSPMERQYVNQNSVTSDGEKMFGQEKGKGLYYVRIPDSFFNKVIGMFGGSVMATIEGKEYLLGLNTRRLRLMLKTPQDTTSATFLCIQPITANDFR